MGTAGADARANGGDESGGDPVEEEDEDEGITSDEAVVDASIGVVLVGSSNAAATCSWSSISIQSTLVTSFKCTCSVFCRFSSVGRSRRLSVDVV